MLIYPNPITNPTSRTLLTCRCTPTPIPPAWGLPPGISGCPPVKGVRPRPSFTVSFSLPLFIVCSECHCDRGGVKVLWNTPLSVGRSFVRTEVSPVLKTPLPYLLGYCTRTSLTIGVHDPLI